MTKEEAILYCDAFAASQDSVQAKTAMQIAKECIQEVIDKENDPCYNCYDKNCSGCLYSGRITE